MKHAFICLLMLLIVAGCSRRQQTAAVPEPSYNGKKLSAWLNDYTESGNGDIVLSDAAQEAVRSLGTDALPWLLSEATLPDAQGQFGTRPAVDRHHAAQRALELLGLQASPAAAGFKPLFEHLDNYNDGRYSAIESLQRMGPAGVPILLLGLKHPDQRTRQECALALGEVSPSATNAVPDLVKLLNDPDPQVRAGAAHALGRIPGDAATVVPALITAFKTAPGFLANLPPAPVVVTDRSSKPKVVLVKKRSVPNPRWAAQWLADIQAAAAEALGTYGPEAKDALPDLKSYLQTPEPTDGSEVFDRQVRRAVRQALPLIGGPTAAAKRQTK